MLDLRRLLVLLAVAQHGSLAGAARELGYTQPAISHHLRRLESEVGTALVIRAGRGVRLTEAARALAARAEAILAQVNAAEAEVATIAETHAGQVRLAAFPSSNQTIIPAALTDLRSRYPSVEVSIVEAGPRQALALLGNGGCDLAVIFEYAAMPLELGSGLVRVPLLTDQLLVVLPAAHPLATATEVALAQLAGETWIASDQCRDIFTQGCALAGFTPRVLFASDDYIAIQRLVAAGVGVTLLPELVTENARLPGIVAVPLAESAHRDIAVVLPERRRQPPAVAATLTAVQHAASSLCQTHQQ